MVRPLLWLKKIKESSTVTKNFRYLCRKFFVTVLTGKLRGGRWPEQATERGSRGCVEIKKAPAVFGLAPVRRERVPSTHGTVGLPRNARLRTARSEEHTSELQSRPHLVCRLLLETKNTTT